MKEVTLKLTVDEVNRVLQGLGRLPFAKVYTLVAKIQEQAGRQLDEAAAGQRSPANGPPPAAHAEAGESLHVP